MRELTIDIMSLLETDEEKIVCVTTNGYVKKDGCNVMGAGIAGTMAKRFPALPKILGECLIDSCNVPFYLMKYKNTAIWSFPTKTSYCLVKDKEDIQTKIIPSWRNRVKENSYAMGFACYSSIELISDSCKRITYMIAKREDKSITVYIPRPGCSNGGLEWSEVKKVIEEILVDDNYVICSKPSNN